MKSCWTEYRVFLIFIILQTLTASLYGFEESFEVRARVTRSHQATDRYTIISTTDTLRQRWKFVRQPQGTFLRSNYFLANYLQTEFGSPPKSYMAVDPTQFARLLGIIRGDQVSSAKAPLLIPFEMKLARGLELEIPVEEERIYVTLDVLDKNERRR